MIPSLPDEKDGLVFRVQRGHRWPWCGVTGGATRAFGARRGEQTGGRPQLTRSPRAGGH